MTYTHNQDTNQAKQHPFLNCSQKAEHAKISKQILKNTNTNQYQELHRPTTDEIDGELRKPLT